MATKTKETKKKVRTYHTKKSEMTPSELEQTRRINNGWELRFKNPKQYVEDKLEMLIKEMYINPTYEEIKHLKSLETESEIDRAVRSIIDRSWDS